MEDCKKLSILEKDIVDSFKITFYEIDKQATTTTNATKNKIHQFLSCKFCDVLSNNSDASYLNRDSVIYLNYQKNLRFLKFKTKIKKRKKKSRKKEDLTETILLML